MSVTAKTHFFVFFFYFHLGLCFVLYFLLFCFIDFRDWNGYTRYVAFGLAVFRQAEVYIQCWRGMFKEIVVGGTCSRILLLQLISVLHKLSNVRIGFCPLFQLRDFFIGYSGAHCGIPYSFTCFMTPYKYQSTSKHQTIVNPVFLSTWHPCKFE